MDSVKLKRFVELEKERREVETRLKSIKEEAKSLTEAILGDFEEAGMTKATIDGVTVYVQRTLWAKALEGDYERACEALRQAGLDVYVHERFNVNSLSAFVRERDKAGEPLPDAFKGAVDVEERFDVKTRLS